MRSFRSYSHVVLNLAVLQACIYLESWLRIESVGCECKSRVEGVGLIANDPCIVIPT